MVSSLEFTDIARERFSDLFQICTNFIVNDIGILVNKYVNPLGSMTYIISNYKLPQEYHNASVFTYAKVEGALDGELMLIMKFEDALTLAGYMLMQSDDEIMKKRKSMTFTVFDEDAYQEACNILCGSLGKGFRDNIGKDFSISQQESKFIKFRSSRIKLNEIFPGNPCVGVESRIKIENIPETAFIIMFSPKMADSLSRLFGQDSAFIKKRGKLLYIDSHPEFINIALDELESSKIEIKAVSSLIEIFNVLDEGEVSIIMLDSKVGIDERVNICEKIRNHPIYGNIPIIGCAQKDGLTKEVIVNMVKSGANDFIIKPYDIDLLIKKINILVK